MNMHERIDVSGSPLDEPRRSGRGLSRGAIISLVVAAAVVGGLLFWFLGAGGSGGEIPPQSAGAAGASAPTVSVSVPGARPVTASVRVNGSVAARRDLPVGVQGQGGMVTAVLVDEGDYVERGQVLARIDRAVAEQQVAQMRASVAQAEADAQLAQSELERAQALVERGFISTADIERRTATRDSARANVNVAKAQLASMQAQLGQLDVRAPEAGLILQRSVEQGQVVSSGSGALFRIAQGGQMELQALVAEEDLRSLRVGQDATVSLVGSPVDYPGEVWMVEPLIDPSTRQGTARILIRSDGQVRPGGFATGTIDTGTATRPLLPESAVLGGGGESYVYIVDSENRAKRQPVRVGAITPDGVVIEEGLTGDEQVVLSAGAFLNDNDRVVPQLVERDD
jgi:RND family efflux transporter MFP subunit|tara:strand:+ start:41455 stop:42648 length:1194 start_codon:yes stop_codon:yes gene_type:complete